MKLLYIIVVCVLLASCEKSVLPAANKTGPSLIFVKALSNGNSFVQNEFLYNQNGDITTRISYKNYSAKRVAAKTTYHYEDGRLERTESETDFSSSLSEQYAYSKATFEYSNNNIIIQRNNFLRTGSEYELRSFVVYSYNDQKLPVKEAQYQADGSLYGYSTYSYDDNGNIAASEHYTINASGNPVQTSGTTYRHDDKKNPYRNVYHLLENLPYSINRNNIIATSRTNYTTDTQGISHTTTTTYTGYNAYGYPTAMDEQENNFLLEYK